MTSWTEINITVGSKDIEAASACAQMTVPYGIYIEDYSDLLIEAPKISGIDLIDEDLLKKDREHGIVHIYISPEENPMEAVSFISQRLREDGIVHEISTSEVIEEEWATAWKKYYHPVRISENVVVCPSWEEYEREKQTDKIITLDPGMAFGTGTHDTTTLCVKLLDKHVCDGMSMLDVGCGSGILSIAASLLGCRRVVGVDIDAVAVRVAQENAQLNKIEDALFLQGDLVKKVEGEFDIICANIVADVIIRLSGDILPFLKADGKLILSGIIEEREADVVSVMESIGLKMHERLAKGGWVALCYERR